MTFWPAAFILKNRNECKERTARMGKKAALHGVREQALGASLCVRAADQSPRSRPPEWECAK